MKVKKENNKKKKQKETNMGPRLKLDFFEN